VLRQRFYTLAYTASLLYWLFPEPAVPVVLAETVEVVGPKGRIGGAVVVGPPRAQTQVEVSLGNALALGLESGVIAAARHIHMHPRDAREYGVAAGGNHLEAKSPG